MTTNDRLSLTLRPAPGHGVPLDTFAQALRGLDELVGAVSKDMGAEITWALDEMSVDEDGATTVTVKGMASH